MSVREFFKPSLKKIITIIIMIFLSSLSFQYFDFFISMGALGNFLMMFNLFMITITIACFVFGGFDCGPMGASLPLGYSIFASIFSFLIALVIYYIIACILVFIWDRLFNMFGKKSKTYQKISIAIIAFVFVLVLFIVPMIGRQFVSISIATEREISLDKIENVNETVILQKITLKNNFPLSVEYELPDITTCLHNENDGIFWGYSVAYRTEDGKFVEDLNRNHKNVIVLEPKSEIKIYLKEFSEIIGISSANMNMTTIWDFRESGELNKCDSILLISDAGMDNYEYCYKLRGKNVAGYEKIGLIK